MKTKNLLAKLADFLHADRTARRAEVKSIRKVLKKLKEKERNLKDELEDETDRDRREAIAAKLSVIQAQRRKGVELVKTMRSGSGRNESGD